MLMYSIRRIDIWKLLASMKTLFIQVTPWKNVNIIPGFWEGYKSRINKANIFKINEKSWILWAFPETNIWRLSNQLKTILCLSGYQITSLEVCLTTTFVNHIFCRKFKWIPQPGAKWNHYSKLIRNDWRLKNLNGWLMRYLMEVWITFQQ